MFKGDIEVEAISFELKDDVNGVFPPSLVPVEVKSDHEIQLILIIDGNEFHRGIRLYAAMLREEDGMKRQRKEVDKLVKALELTIKNELGKQGEPAFIKYK